MVSAALKSEVDGRGGGLHLAVATNRTAATVEIGIVRGRVSDTKVQDGLVAWVEEVRRTLRAALFRVGWPESVAALALSSATFATFEGAVEVLTGLEEEEGGVRRCLINEAVDPRTRMLFGREWKGACQCVVTLKEGGEEEVVGAVLEAARSLSVVLSEECVTLRRNGYNEEENDIIFRSSGQGDALQTLRESGFDGGNEIMPAAIRILPLAARGVIVYGWIDIDTYSNDVKVKESSVGYSKKGMLRLKGREREDEEQVVRRLIFLDGIELPLAAESRFAELATLEIEMNKLVVKAQKQKLARLPKSSKQDARRSSSSSLCFVSSFLIFIETPDAVKNDIFLGRGAGERTIREKVMDWGAITETVCDATARALNLPFSCGGGRKNIFDGKSKTTSTITKKKTEKGLPPLLASTLDRFGWRKRKKPGANANLTPMILFPSAKKGSVIASIGSTSQKFKDIPPPLLSLDSVSSSRRGGLLIPTELCREQLDNLKVLSQVNQQFVLVVTNDGILASIDQHAADERIRMEDLHEKAFGSLNGHLAHGRGGGGRPNGVSQATVAVETLVRLSVAEAQTIETYANQIRHWGWEWRRAKRSPSMQGNADVGQFDILLVAVPSVLGIKLVGLRPFREYILEVKEMAGALRPPKSLLAALASRACRMSVMFGDYLSIAEAKNLADGLATCCMPFHCAHGRPTIVPLLDLCEMSQGGGIDLPTDRCRFEGNMFNGGASGRDGGNAPSRKKKMSLARLEWLCRD